MLRSLVLVGGVFCSLPLLAEQDVDDSNSPKTGLDPAEIISRFEINYSYVEKETGTKRHSAVFGYDQEVSKKSLWGISVPITSAKPELGDDQSGIGDVQLKYRNRWFKEGKFSVAYGAGVTLDTATDDQLGDGDNEINGGLMMSWKDGPWLLGNLTILSISDDNTKSAFRLAPMFAYQPMGEYISYYVTGAQVSYLFDAEEEYVTAFFNIGKVMDNGDIYYIGSQGTVSGESDDDFVLNIGYRRLF